MSELTSNESMAAAILDAGITALKEIEYCAGAFAYVGLQTAAGADRDLIEIAHQFIGRLSESSASISTFLIDYFDNLEQGVDESNREELLGKLKECKERGEMMHSMILLDPESRAEVAKERLKEGLKERLYKEKGDHNE